MQACARKHRRTLEYKSSVGAQLQLALIHLLTLKVICAHYRHLCTVKYELLVYVHVYRKTVFTYLIEYAALRTSAPSVKLTGLFKYGDSPGFSDMQ
jgi:hypothetical protein